MYRFDQKSFEKESYKQQLLENEGRKPVRGTINNWFLDDKLFGKDSIVISGVHQDGTWIRTSLIVKVSDDLSQAETMNSVYLLGTQSKDFAEDTKRILQTAVKE